ncbi:hypothetical protein V1508DRAFT_406884 [Lipomyces doorenjongii]|uniref:uncharacterized protein n=1 Tax=Lipomyces doorenjongii TaxID=383834 RepID=UPI0034CED5DB
MVGVAGGSKGCANCKQRKIKCDESFPKCLRCIKSNLVCGGPSVRPMLRKQGVGGNTIRSVTSKSSAVLDHDPLAIEHSIQKLLRAFNSTSIPRELALFPEYDLYNYCIKIFVDKFSIGHAHRFGRNVSTWIDMIPQFVLSLVPSSTTFASRALVISVCSSTYQDPDIALLASNWYVQALRHQKELVNVITSGQVRIYQSGYCSRIVTVEEDSTSPSSQASSSSATSSYHDLIHWARSDTARVPMPNKSSILLPENSSMDLPLPETGRNVSTVRGNFMSPEDDSITAGMLLGIYEVLNCASDENWLSLLSGANELMRWRGPESFRTGFNSALFQGIRGMTAIHAMVTRKKSFLNDPEWKTIPWEHSPSQKVIQQYLFDLILEVPEHQEIVDRVLLYSFNNYEQGLDDEIAGPTNRVPHLRKQCRTREVWEKLRETHKKLNDLESRFDAWFARYFESARDFAREYLHLSLTVKFDPATAAPSVPTPRCPATMSDSEYYATHFFRPSVKYATLHDARIVTMYLAARMMVAYLQNLTVYFACLDFEDSLAPNPGERHNLEAYIENKTNYARDIARTICRSGNYMLTRGSNIHLLFPFRVALSTIVDTLERGWIWNELRRMHDMGIRLSLADLNGTFADQYVSEWKRFKNLDVCPGCGEHLRLHTQC